MIVSYVLALADVMFLSIVGLASFVIENRDYRDANIVVRGFISLIAVVALCLAINRLHVMITGEPSSFWMRVVFDGALAAISIIRVWKPEFRIEPKGSVRAARAHR
jgi:hypothetical protein